MRKFLYISQEIVACTYLNILHKTKIVSVLAHHLNCHYNFYFATLKSDMFPWQQTTILLVWHVCISSPFPNTHMPYFLAIKTLHRLSIVCKVQPFLSSITISTFGHSFTNFSIFLCYNSKCLLQSSEQSRERFANLVNFAKLFFHADTKVFFFFCK